MTPDSPEREPARHPERPDDLDFENARRRLRGEPPLPEPALSDKEPERPIEEHEKTRNQKMVSERLEERLEKPERTDDRVSHAPATNLQRGFLRLTLVVSVLAGILVGLAVAAASCWWDAGSGLAAFAVVFGACWAIYAIVRFLVIGYIIKGFRR